MTDRRAGTRVHGRRADRAFGTRSGCRRVAWGLVAALAFGGAATGCTDAASTRSASTGRRSGDTGGGGSDVGPLSAGVERAATAGTPEGTTPTTITEPVPIAPEPTFESPEDTADVTAEDTPETSATHRDTARPSIPATVATIVTTVEPAPAEPPAPAPTTTEGPPPSVGTWDLVDCHRIDAPTTGC